MLKNIAAFLGYANLYASLDRAHVMPVATPLSQCAASAIRVFPMMRISNLELSRSALQLPCTERKERRVSVHENLLDLHLLITNGTYMNNFTR